MFAGFLAGFALTVAWRLTWQKGQPKSTGMWLGAAWLLVFSLGFHRGFSRAPSLGKSRP
jgi:hypothetical protein